MTDNQQGVEQSRYKERCIMEAIRSFGGDGKFFGVFNTTGYQVAIKRNFGVMISGKVAEKHLKEHPRVLQLSGGCHYKYT